MVNATASHTGARKPVLRSRYLRFKETKSIRKHPHEILLVQFSMYAILRKQLPNCLIA